MKTGTKKTHTDLIVFAVILTASLLHICLNNLASLDELWNYNFARQISMGLLPYRDYNMVQTPLFALITSLPLFICRSLFVYRLACSLIVAAQAFVLYKLLSDGTKNRLLALPFVLISILIIDYTSYNTLFLLIALLVYYAFTKGGFKKHAMVIGALVALSVFARQTSGCILLILLFLIIASFYENKAKSLLLYGAGFAVPCSAFLVYFLITSSLDDFWDCCLFSLTSFGSSNGNFFSSSIVLLLLLAAEITTEILILVKKRERTTLIHFFIGIPVLFITVPIIDYSHVTFAVIYFMIPAYKLLSEKWSEVIRNTIIVFISAAVFFSTVGLGISRVVNNKFADNAAELKLIPIDGEICDDFTYLSWMVEQYEINGYSVTFYSSSSVIVSIMNGTANPPYDMFLNGNFPGSIESHMVYVEQACSRKDSIIIIASDYNEEGWQNPEGVLEYVQDNCIIEGSYGRFLICKAL
ncbi:MAG: hypothetical protein K5665_11735 [Saccharofermentans sp.]|nr:hypothetical protein [Saccharofermentans sp.]